MTFPIPLTRTLTAFDLETTGKDPREARIVSFGLTQIKPNGEKIHRHTLVNPGVLIPAESTEKHGIVDADVVDAPRFETLAPQLFKVFTNCDLLGFNIKRYDNEVLRNEFKRCGLDWDPDVYVIDGFRLWQILEPRTLSDAVRYWLKREPTDAHSANGDATDALEVVIAQLLSTDKLPVDLKGLHELQWPKDPNQADDKGALVFINGVTCFNFGKHKGKSLASQVAYANWWASQPDRTFTQRTLVQDVLKGLRK